MGEKTLKMKCLILLLSLVLLARSDSVTFTGDAPIADISTPFTLSANSLYAASGFTESFTMPFTTAEVISSGGPLPCVDDCVRVEHKSSLMQQKVFAISFNTNPAPWNVNIQMRSPAGTATLYSVFFKFFDGVAGNDAGCGGSQTQADFEVASQNPDEVLDLLFTVTAATTTCIQVETIAATAAPADNTAYWFFDNLILGPVSRSPTAAPPMMGGDPHFRPLNGDDVWFTPVGPKTPAVYNLVTHELLQVNTEWEQSTNYEQLITTVGIMAYSPETEKETRVQLALNGSGRNATLVVTVDGTSVAPGVSTDTLVWKGKNRVEVTTKLAVFTYFIAYSNPASYLDFDLAKVDMLLMREAHGILGQTARAAVPYRQPNQEELVAMKRDPLLGCTKCYVEGSVGDYIVTDGIFGQGFSNNLFRK